MISDFSEEDVTDQLTLAGTTTQLDDQFGVKKKRKKGVSVKSKDQKLNPI